MLRVSTIHASSASASAAYYTRYLAGAPGEVPGVWSGRQAAALGLSGAVETEQLERLLSSHHPLSGVQLGDQLKDRKLADGQVVRAVAGFDATFSAPKSVSVLWALTGDERLLEAHDVAVAAALAHLERFGSTTRVRRDGRRLHPETGGLMIASFRQTTSRDDDPQIHTHAVISAKVQTHEGRWLALDAKYLKLKQRMLGGLYQSVLRSELTHRFGVEWGPIVNGQAEIAGFPHELIKTFSKRAAEIDTAMKVKVAEFRQREGRAPSRWERAAIERQASADTRGRKSGVGAADLGSRWQAEAAGAGWTVDRLLDNLERVGLDRSPVDTLKVSDIVDEVSGRHSSWGRPEVVQAICDLQRPASQMPGHRWADEIERFADGVLEHCVDLDPPDITSRRASDGRSLWIEPTALRYSSDAVLIEEEHILTWAIDAHADPQAPSRTVDRDGLDVLQGDAAAAVAGDDRLVLVVGPAGAGKTRMLAAAVDDLHANHRPVFGVAPTAKAARVLARDTGMAADTVAKLLHEWRRSDRPPLPEFQLAAGTTVVVDEAGMLSTPALHQLIGLADAQRWRLALVGDHRQLQAVGRSGLFAELCRTGRVDELERLHRFSQPWEAAASLLLRSGDPRALDAYEGHDRIIPGNLADHLAHIASTWIGHRRHRHGGSLAVVASTNEHVDVINRAVQTARLATGELDRARTTVIAAGERAYVGDVVATRRNDRTLVTSTGETVRNREAWTVTAIGRDGSLTLSHLAGHGTVTLPTDFVREHVRLGYAATEHGWQADTVDHAIALVSAATTRRGLYVAATRGRESNMFCVVTDSDGVGEARDVLEGILALDRADIPAVTQRRTLAHTVHGHQSAPISRCAIPACFEALLVEARAGLAAAKARHAEHAAESQRLQGAVVAAEQKVREIDEATRVDRDALDEATRRVHRTRGDLAEARQRLVAAPRRHRPRARSDVATAERRLEHAEDHLERTRRRTSAAIVDHTQAVAERDRLRVELHRHRTIETLNTNQIRGLERRVDTLATWRRWANGQPVTIERLRELAATLAADRTPHEAHSRALYETINRWANTHGVDLQPQRALERTRSRVGPELAL
jgi:conjugative relaxase-like TrwC/TraI family protein